jgi:hypothetical protein
MLGLPAARGRQTLSERGGGDERLRSRHEARVRRGDGEPPLAVINVDARSVVRIRESRRVEARGLGCVARGRESFSRSRFPNNEKSAPLTKVIVSRDTVYPRRSVLALCVRGNRTKEVSCPRVFIAAPRSNCFARSVFALFGSRAVIFHAWRMDSSPFRAPMHALNALKPFSVSRLLVCPPARVTSCARVRVSVCPRVRVSVCPCRHPTVADLRRSGKETRLRRGKYFIPGEA